MPQTQYQEFYQQYDVAIRAGADAATAAGIQWSAMMFPYVMLPVISIAGVALLIGELSPGRLVKYGFRVAIILWLIVGAQFVPVVRDNVVDTFPNEFATALNGGGSRLTAVQQFDVVDQAAGHFVSRIMGQATSWSQTVKIAPAAWGARGLQQFWLGCMFAVWMGVRMIMHIVLAVVAFSLLLMLFDGTAHIVRGLMASVFGLLMWQLATSILAQVALAGMMVFLQNQLAASVSMSLEQQVDVAFNIAGWFFWCFVFVLMVPSVLGVVAGSAASSIIAAGAMVNAGRVMAGAGNSMSRAAHRMRRGSAR